MKPNPNTGYNLSILFLVYFIVTPMILSAQVELYKYPVNPVFQSGKHGDWDENLWAFDILYDDSGYRMWYIGFQNNKRGNATLGYASSSDGIQWEKHPGNPLQFNTDSTAWGNDLETFDIIRQGNLYKMWYTAAPKDSKLSACIGLAVSHDGFLWVHHTTPVLTPGNHKAWDGQCVSNPSIFYDGTIYHMWYSGWAQQIPKTIKVGYATSRDGMKWEKHDLNPVLTIGEPGSWDDHWVVVSGVTVNDSHYKMWYFGWNLIINEIGLATSQDGTTWIKSTDNPILNAGDVGTWDATMLGPIVLDHDSINLMWYYGGSHARDGYGLITNSSSTAAKWAKSEMEAPQRLIKVQVFNKQEYINIDSLSQILPKLSGIERIDACNKLALAWSLTDEAKSYFYAEEAYDLANKKNYARGKAMALYSKGNSQYVLKNYTAALANQLIALNLFDSLNMLLEEGILLSQIASIHTFAGSYDLASNYYQKSLDVFVKQKDTLSILGTMNFLGEAYLAMGDTNKAFENYKDQLQLALYSKESRIEAMAYEGLGRCFQGHSVDSSIHYLRKAMAIWKGKDNLSSAINSMMMAETYLASGPNFLEETEKYLQKSFSLLLLTIGEGQYQLRWCFRMAEMNMASKRYKEARNYLDQSLKMCKTFIEKQDQQKHESLNHKLEFGVLLKQYMEKIYRLYYELDLVVNNKDRALQHYILATAWRDSVANDQAWKKVSMIEGQYKSEKAQDHIAVLQRDNELKSLTLKKSRIYIFGMASSVLLIILFIIIFLRVRKAKAQHALEIERVKSEKLTEIQKLRSAFFSNISHEFRTPLTLILGPLEKILTKTQNDGQQKDLAIARKNARQLQNLVNQILSISKLESGKMQLHAEETNIVSLSHTLLRSFESLAQQKDITVKFSSEKKLIIAFIDREKFEQMVNNLLSNAFKFTASGGEIHLQIKINAAPEFVQESQKFRYGWFELAVSDTGEGIPAEHLNKVFDRFYQVERPNNTYSQGTGIGLALTKELVNLHSGKIIACSDPGQGTTFSIFIPLGKSHLKPEELTDNKSVDIQHGTQPSFPEMDLSEKDFNHEDDTEIQNSKALLLIVEDNPEMRFFIREDFKKDFVIIEAIDGVDGFEKSKKYIPDIIISDVMMPNMDGNAFCTKVKSDESTSHIPVILLTARALKESKIEGLETGADDFITKPFDRQELQVRVQNLIKQRKKIQDHYRLEFDFSGVKKPDQILNRDEQFLLKAKNIVENRMSNPEFGVEDFAKEMAMSRVQLHRKLRAIVNNSATEFIRSIRLTKAVELLERKDLTISEVAYDVGFNNPSYFSSSFHQKYGIPPTEYAKTKEF